MSDRLDQLMKFHDADPNDTFCTYGIAMEHVKLGDVEQALAWLDRTLAIDADYAYAWYQKARLLNDNGQADAARQAITQGAAAAQRANDTHAAEELAALAEEID